jgi:hypothetical protein
MILSKGQPRSEMQTTASSAATLMTNKSSDGRSVSHFTRTFDLNHKHHSLFLFMQPRTEIISVFSAGFHLWSDGSGSGSSRRMAFDAMGKAPN